VQFDSHPDTWDSYFGERHTHGTPFRRAVEEDLLDTSRSIQVGMRGSKIGGFTSREAQEFVWGLAGLEIVGCDVVEVYPAYDHAQITALLAANVAHEFLSLLALSKKTGSM